MSIKKDKKILKKNCEIELIKVLGVWARHANKAKHLGNLTGVKKND